MISVQYIFKNGMSSYPSMYAAKLVTFLTIFYPMGVVRYLLPAAVLFAVAGFVTVADAAEPLEIRTIGLLVPDTGNVPATIAEQAHRAADFALMKFNRHLAETDAGWMLEIVKRDTKSDPAETLAIVKELNGMGIKAFLGPATSANLREIQNYVADNGMVAISYASGAADLAVPNDRIFRTIADAATFAQAKHALLRHDGIGEVIVVFMDDSIGRSVNQTLNDALDTDDGIAVRSTIKFHPSDEPRMVADSIISALATDHAGVGVVVFDYTGKLVEVVRHVASSSVPGIDATRWYGPDHLIDELHADDAIRSFLMETNYQVFTLAYRENDISLRLDSLMDDAGTYAYATYDALLIMGNAIDAAESDTNGDAIADMIPEAARIGHGPAFHEPIWDPLVCGSGGLFQYAGALGASIELNEAGDLAGSDYTISTIDEDGYKVTHRYDSVTDSIRVFTLPEVVKVDVTISDHGYIIGEVDHAISLAEYCYNLGLAMDGADWRLDLFVDQNAHGAHPTDAR